MHDDGMDLSMRSTAAETNLDTAITEEVERIASSLTLLPAGDRRRIPGMHRVMTLLSSKLPSGSTLLRTWVFSVTKGHSGSSDKTDERQSAASEALIMHLMRTTGVPEVSHLSVLSTVVTRAIYKDMREEATSGMTNARGLVTRGFRYTRLRQEVSARLGRDVTPSEVIAADTPEGETAEQFARRSRDGMVLRMAEVRAYERGTSLSIAPAGASEDESGWEAVERHTGSFTLAQDEDYDRRALIRLVVRRLFQATVSRHPDQCGIVPFATALVAHRAAGRDDDAASVAARLASPISHDRGTEYLRIIEAIPELDDAVSRTASAVVNSGSPLMRPASTSANSDVSWNLVETFRRVVPEHVGVLIYLQAWLSQSWDADRPPVRSTVVEEVERATGVPITTRRANAYQTIVNEMLAILRAERDGGAYNY